MTAFYDELAPLYDLIYPDWEASIVRQSRVLDAIIREEIGSARTVLDVSCGIGTQCIGLAQSGYSVTASDLSPAAVERANAEAVRRGLSLNFSVADMQTAFEKHGGGFDVVISCDNSVPHLLSDAEIAGAFHQFYQCVSPGGLCLISVRDYAAMELGGTQLKPVNVRVEGDVKYTFVQVWEFQSPQLYDLTMYLVRDAGHSRCEATALRSRYYAVSIDRLIDLLKQVGFEDPKRVDGRFFQPLILARKPATASSGL